MIGINGAAARLVHPGDLVILIAYGIMETAEARSFEPRVVFVDADNRITGTGGDPAEALPGLVRGDLARNPACLVSPFARRLTAPGRDGRARLTSWWWARASPGSRLCFTPGKRRAVGYARHQGAAGRRVDAVGAGRHRRRARAPTTTPSSTCATR